MDELKKYLDDHKGFRLTKEMIEKIIEMADNEANYQYQQGADSNDRDLW